MNFEESKLVNSLTKVAVDWAQGRLDAIVDIEIEELSNDS